jgi:hypothetical protein
MTGYGWIDLIIAAAAVTTALYTIWRLVLRPIIHALDQLVDAVPVLMDIAEEFKPDHGTSLSDRLDHVHDDYTAQNGVVLDHILEDRQNFADVKEQLDQQDIALRNIQQATVPEEPPPGTPRRRRTDRPPPEGLKG